MNLELHPIRQPGADREAREPHRFLGIPRAAGVGQKQEAFRVDEIENVRERIAFAGEIGAAQRDGHDFGAARLERVAHQLV